MFNFYNSVIPEQKRPAENISVINYNNPTINMNFASEGQNSRPASIRSRSSMLRKQDDERFFDKLNYPQAVSVNKMRPASVIKKKLILTGVTRTDGLGAQRVRKLLQQTLEKPKPATSILIKK
jgi:hypothetical protein